MFLIAALLLGTVMQPALAQPQGPERVQLTRDSDLMRFPDGDNEVLLRATEGTVLVVLYRDEAQVRVQSGDKLGWVPKDAVVDTTAPVGAPQPVLNVGGGQGVPAELKLNPNVKIAPVTPQKTD
jgi:hypothetical protein